MFAESFSSVSKQKSHREFVEEWQRSMAEAYEIANRNIVKAADYNKQYYDKNRKAHEVEIGVGDKVLVRNMREKGGTGKLRSHWERNLFQVVEKRDDFPVYKVKNVNNGRDVRVLHRNMLMKVDELPEDMFESRVKKKTSNTKAPEKKTSEKKASEKKVAGKKELEKGTIKSNEQVEIDDSTDAAPLMNNEIDQEEEDDENFEIWAYQERSPDSFDGGRDGAIVSNTPPDVAEEVGALIENDPEPERLPELEEVAEVEESILEAEDVLSEAEDTVVETEPDPEPEMDNSDADDSVESEEEFPSQRRSQRVRNKRQIFKYDRVGGNPRLER